MKSLISRLYSWLKPTKSDAPIVVSSPKIVQPVQDREAGLPKSAVISESPIARRYSSIGTQAGFAYHLLASVSTGDDKMMPNSAMIPMSAQNAAPKPHIQTAALIEHKKEDVTSEAAPEKKIEQAEKQIEAKPASEKPTSGFKFNLPKSTGISEKKGTEEKPSEPKALEKPTSGFKFNFPKATGLSEKKETEEKPSEPTAQEKPSSGFKFSLPKMPSLPEKKESEEKPPEAKAPEEPSSGFKFSLPKMPSLPEKKEPEEKPFEAKAPEEKTSGFKFSIPSAPKSSSEEKKEEKPSIPSFSLPPMPKAPSDKSSGFKFSIPKAPEEKAVSEDKQSVPNISPISLPKVPEEKPAAGFSFKMPTMPKADASEERKQPKFSLPPAPKQTDNAPSLPQFSIPSSGFKLPTAPKIGETAAPSVTPSFHLPDAHPSEPAKPGFSLPKVSGFKFGATKVEQAVAPAEAKAPSEPQPIKQEISGGLKLGSPTTEVKSDVPSTSGFSIPKPPSSVLTNPFQQKNPTNPSLPASGGWGALASVGSDAKGWGNSGASSGWGKSTSGWGSGSGLTPAQQSQLLKYSRS